MSKFTNVVICLFLFSSVMTAQQLVQTVRGTVIDLDTQMPLIGAEVSLLDIQPIKGTITNADGQFRLPNVPIGRHSILVSYLGYEQALLSNVSIQSAKEMVLHIEMEESAIQMSEIVITANENKGAPLNDMTLISGRSVSPEQTNRYAGGFNDPSRIVSNFAGVTSTQDGSNDIIVRGNSPKYVQWRLEGMDISNPNHFGDQSGVGGAISTLNNNLLATSDFLTGAFSAEYGNVLSGVYDVKMRSGNNEHFEGIFGFGILGTDVTLEGPIMQSQGGSYLVNYRYSTAGLAADLGLLGDIGGIPKFQDAAFKIVLPSEKLGRFSIVGLAGLSHFLWEDNTPQNWDTPGDNFMREDLTEDYEKEAYLLNVGLHHSVSLNESSFLQSSLSLAAEGITDQVFESTSGVENPERGILNYNNDFQKLSYRASMTYHHKLNASHKFKVGGNYTLFDYNVNQSQLSLNNEERFELVDLDENLSIIRAFVNWKYRLNEKVTLVSGMHNMYAMVNHKYSAEPRLAFDFKIDKQHSIQLGYGKHSQMESIHSYFTKIEQDGVTIEPNKDLDLLKAHHFVLGMQKQINRHNKLKVEFYYQNLYDIPVENIDTSYYSTINEGLEFRYVDLVNEGTGKNYGVEITFERFFHNHFYYLINTSIYNSKYTSLEGVERNTQYNGNYLINVLAGKEFVNLGKRKSQTLALNAKLFYGGGKKIIPLLRDETGKLSVQSSQNRFYDYSKAYEDQIEDAYSITLSATYTWNKPKTTHELFFNVDNVTNHKGRISEYYDSDEENSVGHVSQFGIFPNLMYRLYF